MLFPQRWLPYLMVPLLVLKFGVAGGGAYLYLKRYVKNWDYAISSSTASVCRKSTSSIR